MMAFASDWVYSSGPLIRERWANVRTLMKWPEFQIRSFLLGSSWDVDQKLIDEV